MKKILLISMLFLTACVSSVNKYGVTTGGTTGNVTTERVTEIAPSVYTVKKGDTLFSISWRYGISQQTIMQRNDITNPDKIFIGQQLSLNPNGGQVVSGGGTSNQGNANGYIDDGHGDIGQPNSTVKYGQWVWPMKGRILRYFKAGAVGANGLRIEGKPNQTVNAAEGGVVAYKGSGLNGLGNVVVIKHDSGVLSAYGFLSKIHVTQGQKVKKRQKIGTVGYSPDNKLVLHFEIRKNQEAVNPINYIGTHYHF